MLFLHCLQSSFYSVFFLSSHSTQRQELMYGSILCVCLSHSNSHMPLSLSLSTRPALDYKANWLRQARPPPPLPPHPDHVPSNSWSKWQTSQPIGKPVILFQTNGKRLTNVQWISIECLQHRTYFIFYFFRMMLKTHSI